MNLWWSSAYCKNTIPGLPRIRCVGRSLHADPRYHLTSRHREKDQFSVFQYTLSGYGMFADAGGCYEVPAGSGFLCMANAPGIRYYYPRESKQPWEFIFVTWYGLEETVRHLTKQRPVFKLSESHSLIQELLSWERYQNAQVGLSSGAASRLANHVVSSLVDSSDLPQVKVASLSDQFLNIIQDESLLDLQVEEAAQRLQVSREHLSRIVKRETGLSASEHLQRRRIQAACVHMMSHTRTLKEIAELCGFHDSSHFAKQFKRFVGMTPRKYRQAAIVENDWEHPVYSG